MTFWKKRHKIRISGFGDMPHLEYPPRVKIEGFFICGYGETGRRAGFRFRWGDPCRFESCYPQEKRTLILVQCVSKGCPIFMGKTGEWQRDTNGAFGGEM